MVREGSIIPERMYVCTRVPGLTFSEDFDLCCCLVILLCDAKVVKDCIGGVAEVFCNPGLLIMS